MTLRLRVPELLLGVSMTSCDGSAENMADQFIEGMAESPGQEIAATLNLLVCLRFSEKVYD